MKNIDLLFSDRKAVLELFDVKEEEYKEVGDVLLVRGYNNIVLGKPKL